MWCTVEAGDVTDSPLGVSLCFRCCYMHINGKSLRTSLFFFCLQPAVLTEEQLSACPHVKVACMVAKMVVSHCKVMKQEVTWRGLNGEQLSGTVKTNSGVAERASPRCALVFHQFISLHSVSFNFHRSVPEHQTKDHFFSPGTSSCCRPPVYGCIIWFFVPTSLSH